MEMWRELIRPLDSGLAHAVSLEKVLVSKDGKRMRVFLSASRLLNDREEEQLSDAIGKGFSNVNTEISMRYAALADDFRSDPNKYLPQIAKRLLTVNPGVRPYIDMDCAETLVLSGDTVCLNVNGKIGARYLRSRNAEALLRDIIHDLFGLETAVRISERNDEQAAIRAIEEKRREDESLIAALTAAKVSAEPRENEKKKTNVPYGKTIAEEPIPILSVTDDTGRAVVCGEVLECEIKVPKTGSSRIVLFALTDYTNSVNCKLFLSAKHGEGDLSSREEKIRETLKKGEWVKVRGNYEFDTFSHENILHVTDVNTADKPPKRMDDSPEKRVELHMHTKMSTMDAVASPADLIKRCAEWGHKAVAITDHGVLQAFPQAFAAAKQNKIKLIPGCEGYLIDDAAQIVKYPDMRSMSDAAFVAVQLETSGGRLNKDGIFLLNAVRFEKGKETAAFSELIDPRTPIADSVISATGINNTFVAGKPGIEEVLPRFAKFCQGAVLCMHNGQNAIGFLKRDYQKCGIAFNYPLLDTMPLVRNVYPEQKSHRIGAICKHLKIPYNSSDNTPSKARALGMALFRALKEKACEKAEKLTDLNALFSDDKGGTSYHIILLAKNQQGMTDLNRLVSESQVNYFNKVPRMPRHLINEYRSNLIVGSACEAGELYRAVLRGEAEDDLRSIASFYDYLEIQPVGNNGFLVREGTVKDEEELRDINRHILKLGRDLGKPVAAAGDVHFMEPRDGVFRAIVMAAKGFEDAAIQPPLYLRTTEEMLEEFSYLGDEEAKRVVIETPNAIAESVEQINLFPIHPEGKETFQPFWPDAENDIRTRVSTKAHRIYGDPLPEIVQKRLDKELNSIIGYGFSTLYDIAVKLVEESNRNGYLVGSRGSVGSSLVAFMADITEVNALPAHYVCPNCKHVEFDVPPQYTCGMDLPAKNCPLCGTLMNKDGYNIPFEVFLGFKGDKVPDIDLNFSGEYQQTGQHFIESLFGKGKVFRAGTITTIAEKTAYGYVCKYLEEQGRIVCEAEKKRLAAGIVDVKRSTGQHPGGMVLCPDGYDIYDFTAIQHPADDLNSEFITTHYDFNSMHDVLVKVDMLGHDDPTMLKDLEDLTGIPPKQVPLNDPEIFKKVMELFAGPESMGLTKEQTGLETGTLGVPEFGTNFTRGMLMDTKPTTMEELIRISGLSHGTDVWLNNAQDLVRDHIVPLNKCLCTRDDIMNQLIEYGVPNKVAFDTMEFVRKGKAAKGDGLKPEMLEAMKEHNVPQWFIDSCNKIQYMFPKAHAVAYVTYALRIAYFKMFYPAEYYTCWLKRNAADFSGTDMVCSIESIRAKIAEIEELDMEERNTKSGKLNMLYMLLEMSLRGIKVLPVDIYASDPEKFLLLDGKKILPPISSLDNMGLQAALTYAGQRGNSRFISKEDMRMRGIQPSTIEAFVKAGILGDLPETSQISLFS